MIPCARLELGIAAGQVPSVPGIGASAEAEGEGAGHNIVFGGNIEFHIFVAVCEKVKTLLADILSGLGFYKGAVLVPHKVVEKGKVISV